MVFLLVTLSSVRGSRQWRSARVTDAALTQGQEESTQLQRLEEAEGLWTTRFHGRGLVVEVPGRDGFVWQEQSRVGGGMGGAGLILGLNPSNRECAGRGGKGPSV
jgi:hypothetical protein